MINIDHTIRPSGPQVAGLVLILNGFEYERRLIVSFDFKREPKLHYGTGTVSYFNCHLLRDAACRFAERISNHVRYGARGFFLHDVQVFKFLPLFVNNEAIVVAQVKEVASHGTPARLSPTIEGGVSAYVPNRLKLTSNSGHECRVSSGAEIQGS
jgi:hypothetical protein